MAGVGRGTTPTAIYTTDIDLRTAEVVYLTFKQGSKTLIEKEKEDMEIDENEVRVWLSQEETLLLKHTQPVRMQFRVRFPDQTALKSGIMSAQVGEILKDGVI